MEHLKGIDQSVSLRIWAQDLFPFGLKMRTPRVYFLYTFMKLIWIYSMHALMLSCSMLTPPPLQPPLPWYGPMKPHGFPIHIFIVPSLGYGLLAFHICLDSRT